MDYLPLFHSLQDQHCLVVGGGEIAARKVDLLCRAGARVTVVAPQLHDRLQQLLDNDGIAHRRRGYRSSDLDNMVLVIAATDNRPVNELVSAEARQRHLPVNVVDAPELCTVILPSVIDRSPVIIAVSSSARSPVLARLLRARLETLIPAGYGRLASFLHDFRERVRSALPGLRERRRFWEKIIDSPAAEMVFRGQNDEAGKYLEAALADADHQPPGMVSLIGAGPGDPDLLTFRALRLMQNADVILYDRLVSDAIIDLTRRDAERIYVGKQRHFHALRQEEINELLLQQARAGKRVVRLKGGDPFVFGRGGEEIATLAEKGVPFEIVPGITAANGCAAYAGIPLTHRDYAQSVVLVTGHLRNGKVNLDWQGLVQKQQTLVIYMGLDGLGEICKELQNAGMEPTMPAALIAQGTLPEQQVITDTIAGLPERIAHETIHAPTLLIVGEVVRLHDRFRWLQD